MKRKWESFESSKSSTEEFSSEVSSDEELYRHSDLPMDNNFNTELHYAANIGDTLKCAELLEKYPNADSDLNDQSLIPLDLAAIGGHFETCKIILSFMSDKDIYAERPCGNTTLELILMEAIINEKHFKIFEVLINNLPHPAEFGIVNFSSLLYLAASKGCKQICEIILEKKPETIEEENYFYMNPVHVAATNGYSEIVELFIDSMPRKDIISTLYIERKYDGSLNDNISCSPFILKCINNMISRHATFQSQTGNYCVDVNQDNVKGLFKLLKLYQNLSIKHSFKDHLIVIENIYQPLIHSFNKYIAQNLFKMKTVCKNFREQYPFSLLNADCLENVCSTILEIGYPELGVYVIKDSVSCVGQDSSL